MTIRKYEENDIGGMIAVWNEIGEAGDAFPQEEPLTPHAGVEFFAAQRNFARLPSNGDGRFLV